MGREKGSAEWAVPPTKNKPGVYVWETYPKERVWAMARTSALSALECGARTIQDVSRQQGLSEVNAARALRQLQKAGDVSWEPKAGWRSTGKRKA